MQELEELKNILKNLEGDIKIIKEKIHHLSLNDTDCKPKHNENYWSLGDRNELIHSKWFNNTYDEERYKAFNVYKNQEEAEFAMNKQILIREMDQWAKSVNGDWVADWNNSNQKKIWRNC